MAGGTKGEPLIAMSAHLHEARFLVVLQGTSMNRCRESVLHHFLLVEISEGRVQSLEILEVVEYRLDH